jgi:hypothetical protein
MEDRTTPAVVQGEVWVTRATDTGPVAETVAGVQLRLTPESGASLVAVTNSAGQFDFIDVPVGAYSVEWTVPTGYRVSVEAPTQLVVGETLLNLSAELLSEPTLELQSASVSGIVWFDSDGDGESDAGENRASGIAVVLTAVDGVHEALTDEFGAFQFTNVPEGIWAVLIEVRDQLGLIILSQPDGHARELCHAEVVPGGLLVPRGDAAELLHQVYVPGESRCRVTERG